MKTLLVTFGCSWTYGVGAGYELGQSFDHYRTIHQEPALCDRYSYRGVLSSRYGFDNKNFAHGGSSNQAQFMYAKQYFAHEYARDLEKYNNIIVLHAITSTARIYYYNVLRDKIDHIKYNLNDTSSDEQAVLNNLLCKYTYDHDHEVTQLYNEMTFWNLFYKSLGVKHIWLDTFNHHKYPGTIEHMIDNEQPRDALSAICRSVSVPTDDNKYFYASWGADSDRAQAMLDAGLLNPHSIHPTKEAHKVIADYVAPYIEKILKE